MAQFSQVKVADLGLLQQRAWSAPGPSGLRVMVLIDGVKVSISRLSERRRLTSDASHGFPSSHVKVRLCYRGRLWGRLCGVTHEEHSAVTRMHQRPQIEQMHTP